MSSLIVVPMGIFEEMVKVPLSTTTNAKCIRLHLQTFEFANVSQTLAAYFFNLSVVNFR